MTAVTKVGLVTGGSTRLGKAIAEGLARWGADIAFTYTRSKDRALQTAAEIHSLGRKVVILPVDFGEKTVSADSVIDQTMDAYGSVDILVNNAAIFEPGDWDTTTEENWDRHFNINLKAPFFLSQAFAKAVAPNQRAHIINIADWRGVRPGTDHIAYTLTKSALISMTKSLALALAPNIQVNAIAPGLILPPPGKRSADLKRMAEAIPAKRIGAPEDIRGFLRVLKLREAREALSQGLYECIMRLADRILDATPVKLTPGEFFVHSSLLKVLEKLLQGGQIAIHLTTHFKASLGVMRG